MKSAVRKLGRHRDDLPDAIPYLVGERDWEYGDAETQYLTHNIHRYSGKFIPQIASRAVEILTEPGELVLDPYCGSGTTLLEAALLHRRARGVDLNPLAVLIAKVKTTPVVRQNLERLRVSLTQALAHLSGDERPSLFDSLTPPATSTRLIDPWFTKWFQPTVLRDLVAIEQAILAVEPADCRDIARVAFSDILRKSSNAHPGYPNVMFDKAAKPKSRPLKPFLKSLERVCEMVSELPSVEADWSAVGVELGDATSLTLPARSIDAVISHPPYIGSIPYAEYGLLSLMWFGADPKKLDRELTGGRRQSADVVSRFEAAYEAMIAECFRVLKPRRHMFLMVGNPLVKGELVDLRGMTIRLAEKIGFAQTATTERQGVNRRANKMGAEHLLFFQKFG